MRATGGSIANIASVMACDRSGDPRRGVRRLKAGVIGLTRELASQWGRHEIRVPSRPSARR
jgi:NAD(P)-dependent dehydrogenase (short-subunit alcohol dehydrogenase family)